MWSGHTWSDWIENELKAVRQLVRIQHKGHYRTLEKDQTADSADSKNTPMRRNFS